MNFEDYQLIEFEPSNRKNKKYTAILKRNHDKKIFKIHFGDSRYQQYKDNTKLNIYSHLNHNDKVRRKQYRLRHIGDKLNEYGPGYFSYHNVVYIIYGKYYIFYYISIKDEQDIYDGIHYSKFSISQSRR